MWVPTAILDFQTKFIRDGKVSVYGLQDWVNQNGFFALSAAEQIRVGVRPVFKHLQRREHYIFTPWMQDWRLVVHAVMGLNTDQGTIISSPHAQ